MEEPVITSKVSRALAETSVLSRLTANTAVRTQSIFSIM